MSFDKYLKDIFDIDIWQLKSKYKQEQQVSTESHNTTLNNPKAIQEDVHKLLYSSDNNSEKIINIFISDTAKLVFFKNVSNSLFFKSKVNIYQSSQLSSNNDGINLYDNDFISKAYDLLSIENKRYILTKLYDYADFNS